MTKISINSPGGGSSSPGSLQLENGDAMDSTLRYVTDTSNTQSKLLLSDTTTKVEGTLTVDGGAVIPRIIIDADTNVARILSIRTNDLPRWALRVDGTESGSNAGSDFAIRRYNDAGAFIDAPLSINRANGRVSIIERLLLEADSTATTQSTAVIQNPTANSGIAIVPNGTGAITSSIPDGTATGGNARGQYSVDLQRLRNNANQVAQPNKSFIGGGENNRIEVGYGAQEGSVIVGGIGNFVGANYAFIGGGLGNWLSGNDNLQVIVGGQNNSINAAGGSFIGGGSQNSISGGGFGMNVIAGGIQNTVTSGNVNTISGGQANTASTGTHATVVGGQGNVASGLHASVIGGNLVNATGSKSVAGGRSSTASGQASFSIGFFANAQGSASVALGEEVIAQSNFSFANGYQVESYLRGQQTLGSGSFGLSASAQQSIVTARRLASLTAAATTVLSLDGTGITNLIIPYQSNRSWNVNINWVAVVTAITGTATGVTVGDTFVQGITLGFKRVANISSIVGTPGYPYTHSDASMLTSLLTPTAGASQELALTFTAPSFAGGGSITCQIVAKVELVESAW